MTKQTTDMAAQRFILALVKQNPGLSQQFQTLLEVVDPPKCIHDDFKQVPDPVEAYRKFYCRDKQQFAAWTKRQPSDWWKLK